MKKPTGYLLYEGVTNREPYVAIATMESSNEKTGNMVQIWFLLKNHNPVEAVKSGLDSDTICNGCRFSNGQGCYVNVGQAPLGIWKAYCKGAYPACEPRDYAKVFSGRKVRFGAYGNPSLLPLSIIKSIVQFAKGWTGYFHDWKTNPLAKEYAKYFMASTETEWSYKLAKEMSLRTFHVSPIQPANTIECLSETKNMQCKDCQLCQGLNKSRLPDVWINPHGSKVSKAVAVAMAS